MKKFEHIDDYLTDKLSDSDKQSFEQELKINADLRKQVEEERIIIDAIKNARANELKQMLKNVPIGSAPTIFFAPLRMAASLIVTAALATGLYYYFVKDKSINFNSISTSVSDSISIKPETEKIEQSNQVTSAENEVTNSKAQGNKIIQQQIPEEKVNTEINRPKLDLVEPGKDFENTSAPDEKQISINSPTKLEVSISRDSQFNLHYQFKGGKLVLYGSFDKSLYEIIDVGNQADRSIFLFYLDSYYHLDQNQSQITQLKPITDKDLIGKLKLYREK